MKKKLIVAIVIVLLLAATVFIVSVVNKNENHLSGENTVSLADDCWKHVTDLKTTEQSDGTVEVVLTAPDYVSLAKQLSSEKLDDVTSNDIIKAVKENPETVKSYSFIASSIAEEDVKSALIEQISVELVAFTLEDVNG